MFASISLTDFLSFGPGTSRFELRPLNVLIGPNGSGKSNLVEAFALLRSVRSDLPKPVRKGGGVDEWLFRDATHRSTEASLEVLFRPSVVHPRTEGGGVRYRLRFGSEAGAFVVLDERVENERGIGPGETQPYFFFGYEKGRPMINVSGQDRPRALQRADIDRTQSILSQRRDPESYPEMTRVGDLLSEISIYRSWAFGPDAPIRAPCRADAAGVALDEDFSNLPARLAMIKRDPANKRRLLTLLRELSGDYSDIEVTPEDGRLQLYVTDRDRNVPAHRLSDGTLRYLALVAILLDSRDDRCIVIEEPELGLHPDLFPALRELMLDASTRAQLVVTTHSTQLVDAMTEHPECIVVCERGAGGTSLTRLDAEAVSRWSEFGSLGAHWTSGRIGGTRW